MESKIHRRPPHSLPGRLSMIILYRSIYCRFHAQLLAKIYTQNFPVVKKLLVEASSLKHPSNSSGRRGLSQRQLHRNFWASGRRWRPGLAGTRSPLQGCLSGAHNTPIHMPGPPTLLFLTPSPASLAQQSTEVFYCIFWQLCTSLYYTP